MQRQRVQIVLELDAQLSEEFDSDALAERIYLSVQDRLCNPDRKDHGALTVDLHSSRVV